MTSSKSDPRIKCPSDPKKFTSVWNPPSFMTTFKFAFVATSTATQWLVERNVRSLNPVAASLLNDKK